jgi:hypothetical protein
MAVNRAKTNAAASPDRRNDAETAEREKQRAYSDKKYVKRRDNGTASVGVIEVNDHVFINVPIVGVVEEKYPGGDYKVTDWKEQKGILHPKAYYIAYPDRTEGLVVSRNHPRYKVTKVDGDMVTATLISTLSPDTPQAPRTVHRSLVFKAPPRTEDVTPVSP